MSGMISFRHPVSYEWQRRQVLNEWEQGVLRREEICDADFILKTAARFHGQLGPRPCPICGAEKLYRVNWVYGDNLGNAAGSARDDMELEQLLVHKGITECEVHTVEVCDACSWNHLIEKTTAVLHQD